MKNDPFNNEHKFLMIPIVGFMFYMNLSILYTGIMGEEIPSAGTVGELVSRLKRFPKSEVRVIGFPDNTLGVKVTPEPGPGPRLTRVYFIPSQYFDEVRDVTRDLNISVEAALPSEIQRRKRELNWFYVVALIMDAVTINRLFGESIRKWLRLQSMSFQPSWSDVTFEDVAGIGDAKDQLVQLVAMLKDPEAFQKSGALVPTGYLLVGSPGGGKTLLARAVAGEANVPFFAISGSDLVEIFVGVGARRVRDLFAAARAQDCPAIVFIDEIDGVGGQRKGNREFANEEREQTLNAILVEMDGFAQHKHPIVVIAATNRPDVLDRALLRPGRLDRHIRVNLPNAAERRKILEVTVVRRHLRYAKDVDFDVLARSMPGTSGAQLVEVLNRAAINAAACGRDEICMDDLSDARDELLMGGKGSIIVFEPLRQKVAHHEAGHAVVAWELSRQRSDAPEVLGVSILKDTTSFGRVTYIPRADQQPIDAAFYLNFLAMLLGGRAGEVRGTEIKHETESVLRSFGATSGVDSDLEQAFNLACDMVARWGMSNKLGPTVYLAEDDRGSFALPESVREQISDEVQALLEEAMRIAESAIERNQLLFDAIVEELNASNVLRFQDIDRLAKNCLSQSDQPMLSSRNGSPHEPLRNGFV